jgi:F0F1-type ATP synthase assembly protein I
VSPRTSVNGQRRPRGGVALVGTIGGYVALCILGGLVIGSLADRLTKTSPLFLITGVVVGFVLSFYIIYRLAMGELGE